MGKIKIYSDTSMWKQNIQKFNENINKLSEKFSQTFWYYVDENKWFIWVDQLANLAVS